MRRARLDEAVVAVLASERVARLGQAAASGSKQQQAAASSSKQQGQQKMMSSRVELGGGWYWLVGDGGGWWSRSKATLTHGLTSKSHVRHLVASRF